MTVAIINCSAMLLWGVLVLILVMFSFSVVFLNAVSQYISDASSDDSDVDNMKTFFGSLPMACMTLFMAVSGGVDWFDVVKLLMQISSFYAAIFLLFIVITVLAMMNVINAIFVNDAIETTRMDMDLRMQGEMAQQQHMVEKLSLLFRQMVHESRSSAINMVDFIDNVEADSIKMQLTMLGLTFTDGETLFRLLDINFNGELSIDEFVMGCLRLKSGAILMDINVMLGETKKLVLDSMSEQRASIAVLAKSVGSMCHRLGLKSGAGSPSGTGSPSASWVFGG